MKLTQKNRRIIALAIGVAIILLGLLQGLKVTHFDDSTLNEVTFIMLIAGIALIYTGRNNRSRDGESRETDESSNAGEIQSSEGGQLTEGGPEPDDSQPQEDGGASDSDVTAEAGTSDDETKKD